MTDTFRYLLGNSVVLHRHATLPDLRSTYPVWESMAELTVPLAEMRAALAGREKGINMRKVF